MNIDDLIADSHTTALEKGWWEGAERNFGEQIALMHSELSEVLEEYRVHGLAPERFFYYDIGSEHPDKPEGIAAEFADVLIRIADTCGRYGIPLARALTLKGAYNSRRPYRHGGKKA